MALSLTWSLLARRVVAVLGLALFLAVGVLVFSRNAMRADMPTFLEDAMIIPRAYTKGIGSLAPLVRLEIEADTVSAHLVEGGEHAAIYVISRDTGYVARGHRRRLEARERKDAAFAFATIEFEDMARRMHEATEVLGEPPRSVEIIRPTAAQWLLWRVHGTHGHVDFGKDGALLEPTAASATD
jgi:hypothetical protein